MSFRYVAGVRDATASVTRTVRRYTVGAFVIRGTVLVSGFAALLIGMPDELYGTPPLVFAGMLALLTAASPGSWLVLLLELVAVLGWMVGTIALDEPITWLSLTGLAVSLYLHHTASAWAALVPLDTVLAPVVWARWLARVAAMVSATGVLAAVALLIGGRLELTVPVLLPVLGVVAATFLAGLLAYLLHRR